MKKLFIVAFAATFFAANASAQFFSTKQGEVLNYKSIVKNGKKEKERAEKTTIIQVETAADGVVTARVENLEIDPENPFLEIKTYSNFSYAPSTDVTTVTIMSADDFTDFFVHMIKEGMQSAGQQISDMDIAELRKAMSVKGSLEFQLDPKAAPDTKLPNSTLRLNVGQMTMSMNLWEGKVLGTEKVTTDAGEFDCIKISYILRTTTPNGNEKDFVTEWYAKGVGQVKSVKADKKGNVNAETTLTSIQ